MDIFSLSLQACWFQINLETSSRHFYEIAKQRKLFGVSSVIFFFPLQPQEHLLNHRY